MGFEVHAHLGELGWSLAAEFVVASVGKLGLHQFDVCLAQLGLTAFALKVVVALAHADAGLVEPSNALVGISCVGLVEEGEEGVDADTVETAHLGLELVHLLDGGNLIQIGHDGFGTLLLDGGSVHTHSIEGGNLVAIAAGLVRVVNQRVDKSAELLLVGLGQHVEGAIAAVLGIERIVLHPATAGILLEVVGRPHTGIKVIKTDTRAQLC